MKPITDDVVHSLIQGIESRERSKRPGRKGPAKIIDFTRSPAKSDVVQIEKATPRKTISGVFCYVARLGTA